MASYKSTPLFGGAITADLPSTFQDVSTIRQVPDTQEVYLDSQGFSSVVFDILERVTEPSADEEAVKFHLEDIVEDAEGVRVWDGVERVGLEKMPTAKAYTLLAISPPGEKMKGRANEPEFVGILLLVVRLEAQETDVVIAVNVPHMPGELEGVDLEAEKPGKLLEAGQQVRAKICETFEVKDWGLFGE